MDFLYVNTLFVSNLEYCTNGTVNYCAERYVMGREIYSV